MAFRYSTLAFLRAFAVRAREDAPLPALRSLDFLHNFFAAASAASAAEISFSLPFLRAEASTFSAASTRESFSPPAEPAQ